MRRILIVDDSIFSQKVIASMLKKHIDDAEYFFASDGEEGLSKYKELNPDYVLLDLLMPKMDGKTLICLLKEQDPNAKIIVISADVQKSVREEIDQYQVLSFLNKPFTEEKAKLICAMIEEK